MSKNTVSTQNLISLRGEFKIYFLKDIFTIKTIHPRLREFNEANLFLITVVLDWDATVQHCWVSSDVSTEHSQCGWLGFYRHIPGKLPNMRCEKQRCFGHDPFVFTLWCEPTYNEHCFMSSQLSVFSRFQWERLSENLIIIYLPFFPQFFFSRATNSFTHHVCVRRKICL